MTNIMFTNVTSNGETLDDGDNNVIVFTSLGKETLQKAFKTNNIGWDDCYEVPSKDLQFYLYQACYLNDNEERQARKLAKLTPA